MSSNIKIPKFCTFCGQAFVAQKTTTRFCGHTCASRAHKQRVREKKVQDTLNNQIKDITSENLNAFRALPVQTTNFINLRDKDFLSIEEASILLGTSRWTIQRMIKSNRLPVAKLGDRTIIKRASIDNLFNQ